MLNALNILTSDNVTMHAQLELNFLVKSVSQYALFNIKFTLMVAVFVLMAITELELNAANVELEQDMTILQRLAFPSALNIQFLYQKPQNAAAIQDITCSMVNASPVQQVKHLILLGVAISLAINTKFLMVCSVSASHLTL